LKKADYWVILVGKEGICMRNNMGKDSVYRIRNLFAGSVLLALGTGLLLAACTDFYSTTWGEAFARDPSDVKVTSSNVYELLKDANGDKEASRAILKKLIGTDDPELQAAAVKAANQAAGLTELVVSNLGTLTGSNAGNADSLESLAKTIMGEVKENDIRGIADDVAGTLPVTSDNPPQFKGSFASSVPTSDLTLLLIAMMLAEVPESDEFDDYTKEWGSGKKIDGSGNLNLDGKERIIAATANEVIGKRPDSELGDMLRSLVGAK
jgi:hypothetical protein